MAKSHSYGLVVIASVLSCCICQSPFDEFLSEALGGDSRNFGFFSERGRELIVDNVTKKTPAPMPKPEAKGSCGGKFTDDEGVIASPGYPTKFYPSHANCSWEIKVSAGKAIMMNFTYMDVEVGPPDCPFDGVLVVDYLGIWNNDIFHQFHGPVVRGVRDPLTPPAAFGRYCGGELFKPFTSITNAVRIGFYSDSDSEGSGFVLQWKAVDIENGSSSVIQACDFEEGLCPGWENVQTDKDTFDWNITSGETITENTGPRADHTKNNIDGKYVYIEASRPRVWNDTALLSSPKINFGSEQNEFCLEFWYHMYGKSIGSLVIGLAIGEKRNIEWMVSGEQGEEWLRAVVPIHRVEQPFNILFAAVRGNGYAGDIAVDDVTIYGKPCDELVFTNSSYWPNQDGGEKIPDGSTSCQNINDYSCENSSKCINDFKLCDGIPDCPHADDESDHFCAVDATTAVPPPPYTTDDSPYDSTIIVGSTQDMITDTATEMTKSLEISTASYLVTIDEETAAVTANTTPRHEKVRTTTVADKGTLAFTRDIAGISIVNSQKQTIDEVEPTTIVFSTDESTARDDTTSQQIPSSKPIIVHVSTLAEATTQEAVSLTTTHPIQLSSSESTKKTASTKPASAATATSVRTPQTTTTMSSASQIPTETTHSTITTNTRKKLVSTTKKPASRLTAIANMPTVADKQTGDEGSSACRVSAKSVIILSLCGLLIQWLSIIN